MKKYNTKDINSIYNYAKKLIGKTFRNVEEQHEIETLKSGNHLREQTVHYGESSRKGGLGNLIEDIYFQLGTNNLSQPDFGDVGLELKVTPYKINKNKTISAKERLVLSMINFMEIVDETFFESNLWSKLENILLIYYLFEDDKERLDYLINFVYLFSPDKQDLEIIIEDFNKIKQKVLEGRAHELSESDTLYLGAVTKASDSTRLTEQPNSETPAKPRAFSLKNSYMTSLLRGKISKTKVERIINEPVKDFESFITNKINKNIGLTKEELINKFDSSLNPKTKHIYSLLTYRMLGVKGKNALEFEKANIEVKTIRLTKNGKLVESMSFPTFKVIDLIEEKWETSDLYERFSSTKFLFVIYKEFEKTYKLEKAIFWNMPTYDLDNIVKSEWELTRKIFKDGVKFTKKHQKNGYIIKNNLPKMSETEIIHVRNHSSKSVYLINGIKEGNGIISRDGDLLPNGDIISKQCFWLNNKYVLKQIKEKNQIS